jgi:Fe-S-cluster containining protein
MPRPLPNQMHLPEGMAYTCIQCGRGCMDFFEIPVDAESEARLRKLDLKAQQQAVLDEDPIQPSQFDPQGRTLCRSNNACVFLTGQKLCALHREYGLKNKPQACIDFPFTFVDTPHGAYAGLSFACTAVLEELGEPVTDQREYLLDNFTESVHVKQSAERPQLTGRIAIDFDAYLELERALDDILALPNIALPVRLLAQAEFVDVVVRTFEAARLSIAAKGSKLTTEEKAAAAAATDVDLMRGLAERFRSDKWGRLLIRAHQKRGTPSLHRAFVGMVTTFRQAFWTRVGRVTALTRIGRSYLANAMGSSRITLMPLRESFRYSDFKKIKIEAIPGAYWDHVMTRYLRHRLFRKDLLVSETIRTGHRLMLLHFALVNWYIVGMTSLNKLTAPTQDIIRESIRNAEQYYVHHTTLSKVLETQPLLASLVDSVLSNKRYAASIVYPPVKRTKGDSVW